MSKSLGIGVIGCGNISAAYMRLAPLFKGIEMRACADMNAAAAEARAKEFGLRAETVEGLLAAKDVDIIVNLTVPNAHFAVSKAILEAGKHSYSEKPFVLTLEEGAELKRIAAAKGASILFVPFNTDIRSGYLRVRSCAQARCIENHIYTVLAGPVGNLPFVENSDIHYAQSGIFTPADVEFARDAIAAECNPNVETVIIHDLDFEQLRRHRESGSVQNWNDRRRDLYRVKYDEGEINFEI